jgi:hypothetical protein
MKKVLILFALALVSCSAEPIPSNLQGNGNSSHYAFDWDSNQENSHATFTIYKQGIGYDTDVLNKHFEVDIPNNTIFRFFIRDTTIRPYCSLKISKRKPMDLSSGVYEPNSYNVIFNESHSTNYFNFGATIEKNGNFRMD